MTDTEKHPEVTEKPKKRKINGRQRETAKMERLSSHTGGPPCNCQRYKCFEMTSVAERQDLLEYFNILTTKDAQDSLLASFITVNSIKQRRPRGNEETKLHDHSYSYSVEVVRDGMAVSVTVCLKAILSIFGIKKSRIERIRASLANTGLPPTDQRGKHDNRPHAFTADMTDRIIRHIKSFSIDHSHNSLNERIIYLPKELSVKKMHQMYMEKYPDDKCSYESYRKHVIEKFNITFGYPPKETSSKSDEEVKVKLEPEGW